VTGTPVGSLQCAAVCCSELQCLAERDVVRDG